MTFALEFPPISHTVNWPDIFGSGPFAVNKVVLLMWLSAIIVFAVYFVAGRRQALVPRGTQNVAESIVDFIQRDVILQTIGPDGMGFTPFLLTIFSFVLVGNLWGIIPFIQMPVNGRIALPVFMAVLVWVLYNFLGVTRQGPLHYLKSIAIPPGVPKALLPLIALIEFVSFIFVQPFALAIRLFANMLAGHLLLISFAVIASALFSSTIIGASLPLVILIGLTGFEVLVAVLQAFIFTILTALYISMAMNPQH